MKCIQCGTDNNLRDRTANSGQCKNCHHPFAFEPDSMGIHKITDPFFAKAIADISANQTLFFTPKQLFYLLDRRAKSKNNFSLALYIILYFCFVIMAVLVSIIMLEKIENYSLLFIPTLIVNILFIFGLISATQTVNSSLLYRQNSVLALRLMGIFNLIGVIPINILNLPLINSVVIVILGIVEIYLANRQKRFIAIFQTFLLDKNQFKRWLNRWQQINGKQTLAKMLASPSEESTSAAVSPEITAYSFDRLIVCDSAIIAQLLIANNFHFENNCAILSITGYPQSIFATAMEMLRRNPDLKVYTLHDCSPHGIGLANHLRNSENWFLNTNFPIIDIGILPRQVIAAKRDIFIQNYPNFARDSQQLPAAIRSELSPEELAWLDAGNFVELESFSPQKLIQILHRGIAGSENLEGDNSGLVVIGDTDSSYIYVAESFG